MHADDLVPHYERDGCMCIRGFVADDALTAVRGDR
jgi:hypothetical protein